MDVSKLTEDAFLGTLEHQPEIPDGLHEELEPELTAIVASIGRRLKVYGDGFAIYEINGTDTVATDKDGKAVGFYTNNALATFGTGRNQGLSTPLILFASERRASPPGSRNVTPSGEVALRRAWRVANGEAHSRWP